MFCVAALEGQRRVLGDEHIDTLSSLNNIGLVFHHMEDYGGALAYYQQVLKGEEKILGKTHPETLWTIMNMANTYQGTENLHKGGGYV